MDSQARQFANEQRHLDAIYARLDELRDQARQRLAEVQRAGPSGSPQNRSERDSFATLHAARLAQLDSVEDRLCFGRLDLIGEQAAIRHIGRIGLTDAAHTPLLTDWRAPAAEPFYQATAVRPLGVGRRRHIATRLRQVTGLEDELLDIASAADPDWRATLSGEGALLAAMSLERTGRMADIVATIQGEQDAIIRAPLAGPLVVQGGPGTGKTAVALHRAAFLLYTHRQRLANSGVLVVGPSRVFLHYIDQVLPSLGETGVVATTIGDILPGLSIEANDPPWVAQIKGRVIWGDIIRRAVRQRQRLPAEDTVFTLHAHRIVMTAGDVEAAQDKARQTGRPYNQARAVFVREILHLLQARYIQELDAEVDDIDRAEILEDLRTDRAVRTRLNLSWLPMSPAKLLEDLLVRPELLAAAAPELSEDERAALRRPVGAPWTVSDVPLLDEAAELLGEDDAADKARRKAERAQRKAEVAYARGVLAMQGNSGMVSPELLADRFAESGSWQTLAERAAQTRTWAYGHVVVDEAQELTAMEWRMLLRRCPTRSMTIVGDIGQTHAAGGARSWSDMLGPVLGWKLGPGSGRGRWRREDLTINYRTPARVMALAERVARAAGLTVTPTTPARDVPESLRIEQVADPVARAIEVAADWTGAEVMGRVAVIGSEADVAEFRRRIGADDADGDDVSDATSKGTTLLAQRVAGRLARPGESVLDATLVTLTPRQAKGLEFDDVILIEPGRIVAEGGTSDGGGADGARGAGRASDGRDASPGAVGASDLYVAMTRPTQRLVVIYHDDLPAGFTE